MDDLSPLFHEIEFNERFRGYDVEEVDAYVDRVAKAAALVQGRIAELQERVAAAEAAPRPAAPAPAGEYDDSRLSRVLVLAQRTADAAIEEAKAEAEAMRIDASADAERMRREADDHASLVLAEAETDRRRLIAEAEEAAAGAVAAERARVAAEVAELERHRAFLTDDIAILEQHLAEARLTLAASASVLTDLLEAPEAFRPPAVPATSGVELPPGLLEGRPPTSESVTSDERTDAAEVALDDAPIDWAVVEPPPAPAVDEPHEAAPAFEDEPTQAFAAIELDEDEPTQAFAAIELDEAEPPATMAEAEAAIVEAPVEHVVEPVPEEFAAEFQEAAADPFAPATTFTAPAEPAAVPEAEMVDAAAEAAPVAEPEPFEAPTEPEPIAAEADGLTAEPDLEDGPVVDDIADAVEALELAPDEVPTPDEPTLVFDVDLVDAEDEVAGEEVVDLTDPPVDLEPSPPAADTATPQAAPSDGEVEAATAVAPPRLVTAEDIEATTTGDWIDELREPSAAEPRTEELLFAPAEAPDNDHFLDQLREAVARDEPEEFGEDALAAFFDDGDDGNERGWFNRRR